MLLFFLFFALLARVALYLNYHEDFKRLDAAQVFASFLYGLRFDLSMAAVLVGIPLLLLLLPFRWSNHRHWQNLWNWFIYFALALFAFTLATDFIYFGYVHRHVGSEINVLANDMNSMFGIAFRQYGVELLAYTCGALLMAWLWQRLFSSPTTAPRKPWLRLAMLPVLFLLMLICGRGGIYNKPISVGEAFFSNITAQGYLALNGAFATSRALIESPPPLKTFMPQDEAIALMQHYLAGDKKVFVTPDYPLFQTLHAKTNIHQPNVIVLMLESWGAQYIDSLRKQMHLPLLGATPNFDELARHGRLYTRFYANGQRSIQGAEAILASQPTFPGMPFLGEGIEQNRQNFLGQLARSQGYETLFLQSSDRGSLRFDAISERAGFSTYRGAEDIPNLHEYPKPEGTWGTWDHNTLQAAHTLFAAAHKPFLGFVFTSSTHTPWLVPDARFEKYKGGDREAFLNSLFYADWALGQLVAAAKQAGYFDNTIFVLVADHANEFVDNAEEVPNLFHIPLLIAGPGITSGEDDRVGSQFDILPTLIELCGWQVGYAGMGRSLLDDSRKGARASMGIRDTELNWIASNGWVSHNLEHSLSHAPYLAEHDVQQLEQILLAAYQTTSQLQSSNHILPPEH